MLIKCGYLRRLGTVHLEEGIYELGFEESRVHKEGGQLYKKSTPACGWTIRSERRVGGGAVELLRNQNKELWPCVIGRGALPQVPRSQPRKFPEVIMLVGGGICNADQKKDSKWL